MQNDKLEAALLFKKGWLTLRQVMDCLAQLCILCSWSFCEVPKNRLAILYLHSCDMEVKMRLSCPLLWQQTGCWAQSYELVTFSNFSYMSCGRFQSSLLGPYKSSSLGSRQSVQNSRSTGLLIANGRLQQHIAAAALYAFPFQYVCYEGVGQTSCLRIIHISFVRTSGIHHLESGAQWPSRRWN